MWNITQAMILMLKHTCVSTALIFQCEIMKFLYMFSEN